MTNETNFEVKEYCGTRVNILRKRNSDGIFFAEITPVGHMTPHVRIFQYTKLDKDGLPWGEPKLEAPSFGNMDIDFTEMFIACLTAALDVYKNRLKFVGKNQR